MLASSDPRAVIGVIRLSRASYRKMLQNLAWGAGYNVFALPLAAGALTFAGVTLCPAVGANLMSASPSWWRSTPSFSAGSTCVPVRPASNWQRNHDRARRRATPVPDLVRSVFLPLAWLTLTAPRWPDVTLDGATVRVRMGLGGRAFRAEFPRSAVASVDYDNSRPVRRGVHGWMGRGW